MNHRLASSFAPKAPALYSESPLSDEQIRRVAPSIFAEAPHDSRSERYAYIPTAAVLTKLRGNGFEPFMVAQTRVRSEDRREFTKHMLRLRHASQTADKEAYEVILLNSHDGTSSYQMMSGLFRFVCKNGMVCGDLVEEVRIPHKGNVADSVVEGAFAVLDGADLVREVRDDMRSLTLNEGEEQAFAHAALQLRYDPETGAAPVTERDILRARRMDDTGDDLWSTFNRVQENMLKGGLNGRARNGRRTTTRAVTGIDQGVKLNRALFVLAQEMKRLKG
ncbi:MAG TPA: DUF932 domain-containing protein [Ottowia sp.]|nr:DUF932 domain-containing protein [Ottowia sp.]